MRSVESKLCIGAGFDRLTQSTGEKKVSVPLGPSLGPVNRILSSREFIVPKGKRYYVSPASPLFHSAVPILPHLCIVVY